MCFKEAFLYIFFSRNYKMQKFIFSIQKRWEYQKQIKWLKFKNFEKKIKKWGRSRIIFQEIWTSDSKFSHLYPFSINHFHKTPDVNKRNLKESRKSIHNIPTHPKTKSIKKRYNSSTFKRIFLYKKISC